MRFKSKHGSGCGGSRFVSLSPGLLNDFLDIVSAENTRHGPTGLTSRLNSRPCSEARGTACVPALFFAERVDVLGPCDPGIDENVPQCRCPLGYLPIQKSRLFALRGLIRSEPTGT